MRGYGQFCPLALASEIIGERWTPLILRELMLGSRHFNDIHRGVPRMSPALLSRRLKMLVENGIVERRAAAGRGGYVLSEAGRELTPVLLELAVWGKRWLPSTLSQNRADPDLVMWDMHRRIDLDRLPEHRIVIQFSFHDQPTAKRDRWLVGNREEVDLCIKDPGYEIDLFVETDSRTMTWVWYGDIALSKAISDRRIELHGPPRLCREFPRWLQLSVMAPYERRHAS